MPLFSSPQGQRALGPSDSHPQASSGTQGSQALVTQALVTGGHTSGYPALKTIALNAACFVSLNRPTQLPVVGTGSHGYTVTDPSKARNKFFRQKFSD